MCGLFSIRKNFFNFSWFQLNKSHLPFPISVSYTHLVGFLLLIILVVGIYVSYTGLIKRETSKALHAVINFVVVFILSASFIAYAPDYIKKINEFSSDISTASLDLGTKIIDRKSTRLNSSHSGESRMPSSA